jgi:hypothetical protein
MDKTPYALARNDVVRYPGAGPLLLAKRCPFPKLKLHPNVPIKLGAEPSLVAKIEPLDSSICFWIF